MIKNLIAVLIAFFFIFASVYLAFSAARGSGSYTSQSIGPAPSRLYLPAAREDSGYGTDLTTNSLNLNNVIIASAIFNLETISGNTNYILNRVALQAGTTVYITSLSVDGQTVLSRTSGGTLIGFPGPIRSSTLLDVGQTGGTAQIILRQLAAGATVAIQADSERGLIGTPGAHSFSLFSNNNERVTVSSGGNVGVGLNQPLSNFHIVRNRLSGVIPHSNSLLSVENVDNAHFSLLTSTGGGSSIFMGNSRSVSEVQFEYNHNLRRMGLFIVGNTTPTMSWIESGLVAIGTYPATGTNLDIANQGGTANLKVRQYATGTPAAVIQADADATYIGSQSTHTLNFLTSNNTRMSIDLNGVVSNPGVFFSSANVNLGDNAAVDTIRLTGTTNVNNTLRISTNNYIVGAMEGKAVDFAVTNTLLTQITSVTVNGSLTVDFSNLGLRDYINAPIVFTSVDFDSDGNTALDCTSSNVTATGLVIECILTTGDGVAGSVAADGVNRQVNLMLVGRSP